MKLINILFNYKKSSHNQVLGVERCFLDYSKNYIAKGDEVVSVMKNGMIYKDEMLKTGSKVVEMSAFGKGDILSMIKMTLLFLRFDADIAICHSGRALFFARIAKLVSRRKFPIVVIDHGVNPKKFLKADYVLTVNSFFNKELVKAGKDPKTAFTIPNMTEVPKGFVPPVKEKFGKKIRVGSLGRLFPEKCFDKMVQAMAILRDRGIECEYVIGGVGHMEDHLNNLAKELKVEDNFKILGWTTDKDKFFNSIDLFVLPSSGETFGIVLLEAMLYKTPIITSNSWGPDEVIDQDRTGLKVCIQDARKIPTLLADAIEKMVNDEESARKMAENAYNELMEKYTSEIVMKKLDDTIVHIVQREKRLTT